MSISISPPQSCTERSQSYVFSSAIGGEVAAHRNLLSRTMLFGQGLFLQNFTFPNRKKRWSLFHCVRACSWLYLPFVHNACNFTGKGGIALDNATRYGLYRKVVKYRWRLGVRRTISQIVHIISSRVVSSQIVLPGGRSICTNSPEICCLTTAFQMSY